MSYQIVRLHFRQPLHLSRGKPNTFESSEQMLHSDTLQAALYVCALQLFDHATAEDFRNKVLISSAFPWTETDGYWLPKPSHWQPESKPELRKIFKKITWLQKKHFDLLLEGKSVPPAELIVEDEKGQRLLEPKIWEADTTQRVLLDRIDSRSTPFYLEKLYPVERPLFDTRGKRQANVFNGKRVTGHTDRSLYVLVQNEGFPYLEALFRLLGDNGIGLQRSLGNGAFEAVFAPETLNFPAVQQSEAWVSLSLFRPNDQEFLKQMHLDKSHYQLLKRGGWVSSPEDTAHMRLRKSSVLMFAEGAVLAFQNGLKPQGDFVDLDPRTDVKHPVWRDGRGMFLPIKF
ncbi:MAG: type III-A CRISPR-associated RAMP protein Csm4 [Chitinophagales bacterium]|nr:type III-A CRISPR-associated RAMP protein Csm4 [Chitinophagales bacterium]